MHKRVVVTGCGVISPVGIGKEEFWNGLICGKVAANEITTFDTSEYSVHRGGEVRNFSPHNYLKEADTNRMGRASIFAIAAAKMALTDAKLNLENFPLERIGVSLGTTMGEQQILEEIDIHLADSLLDQIHPRLFNYCPSHVIPSNVAVEFNIKGPNVMIPTACAAGNYAIGWAYDLLRLGRADIMLAGGVDPFTKGCFTGFARLGAIAPEVCQPFDRNRKGILVSEGAGIIVLETLNHALQREAPIYAEIGGYGLSCDAHHMTAPHPDAHGAIKAMENALIDSRISPAEVDYISAHGTGTQTNDRMETIAVKKVFGQLAHQIPISSIKSMIGHTMGAASAIEAITCVLVIENSIIPPTMNHHEYDPECDLDIVPNVVRDQEVDIALSNSYAFGGNNSCLVIKKFR